MGLRHMGRFPQDGNFACFVSLLKKTLPDGCGQILFATPIILLFCGEHDYLIILAQPQLPINSLQCTAIHSKCTKNALFCATSTVHFWCILNALQCILVN